MKKNNPFPIALAAPDVLPPGVAGAHTGALAATELLVALFDAQDRLCWCNAAYAHRAKLLGRDRSEPAGAADGSGLNTAASS